MRWYPASSADSAAGAEALFTDAFGGEPEGIWSAPGRVNLIGEHVDYAGGVSLPFALPQRTFTAVRRRDDGKLRMTSGQIDAPGEWPVALISPGQPEGWAAYPAGVVWAMQQDGLLPVPFGGADIAVHSDVPVGAGLSSSAALECSLALALTELTGTAAGAAGSPVRTRLASACVRAENEIALANTGGMDQTVAMHARAGYCLRIDNADGTITPIPLLLEARGLAVLVIDTNAPHRLVDGQYASRRATITHATQVLGLSSLGEVASLKAAMYGLAKAGEDDPDVVRRVRHVVTETERARAASAALTEVRIASLGPLLTASHASLRDDYRVSSFELDTTVDAAVAAGALGARMVGGGFGGSVIALVWESQIDEVAKRVADSADRYQLPAPTFLYAQACGAARRVELGDETGLDACAQPQGALPPP
ncbi:MAG TPA: galactokinase [Pseudonocardia sp.]|jgi:galactokinase|nr:galactokinase [Pseudonocardia sp.]